MKKFLLLFILLFFTCLSFAQELIKDSTKGKIARDTSLPQIINTQEIQTKFYEFELNYKLNDSGIIVPDNINSRSIWLWTSYAISKNEINKSMNSEAFNGILSPLYDEYLRNSKFSFVKYMLGMAQYGAVGYLAYRHIKKWGFFK
jgi:hypothetical protein